LVKEGLAYYAYVITQGGELQYLNFGSSVSSSLVESANRGTLGVLANGIAIDIVRTAPYWKGLVVDFVNLKITKIYFSSSCSYVSAQQSTLRNPTDFNFTAGGSYAVELTAYHQNGNLASQQSVVNVSSQTAPSLNFTIDNSRCINVANTFTSQSSENLVHTTWSFGDGTNDDGTNTTTNHTFTSTGQKTIGLEAKGISGCSNFKSQTISIFNPPNASFTLPVVSPYCSNQLYTYTNTSTSDSGSSPSWQWSVNGQNIATTQDLNYLFATTSSQSVSLAASIPGCSTQATQSVTSLVPGPLITFNSPSTGCTNTSITFTNVTTDPVTGFSWSFGDGNSSSAFSSSNTYATTGQYQVLLSASNAAGCQNSFSQTINIYSVPQPDFAIEAPPLQCEKWPAQFDNLTPPLPDSNIASWQWSFGDVSNGASLLKNPSYTYATAGDYTVTLQAKSNFNCTNSIQKTVTIFPSPQASFSNDPACVNQSAQFKNKSTGNIATYQWSMDGNTFTVPDPAYTFKSSGNYPVTLTVASSSGCVSQYPSTVVVPAVPNLAFSVQGPCTGHPTIFQELNAHGADPTTKSNWSFAQVGDTDSPVSFQFSSAGTYPVTMTTTRNSGCTYSFSKNVNIFDGPVASFTPSVLAGAAPLAVAFANNSSGDSNTWNFGDQSPLVDATSPPHTFASLGTYKVLLTTKSHTTCSDTASVVINVVIPHIDIVMNSFSLTSDPNSNSSKPVVSILNSGNIPLVNPDVVFDLGGGVLLKEKLVGTVKPGKSVAQTLDVQIVPQAIQFVCAEIDIDGDVNTANNKQCISLSNDDVVMSPYPNPSSSGKVALQWIGAIQENVRITIYKSNGDIAFSQNLDGRQSGLSQITIDTSSFANGLYLIQFVGDKLTKTFRIVIAN
jgi:PKD repeat protein